MNVSAYNLPAFFSPFRFCFFAFRFSLFLFLSGLGLAAGNDLSPSLNLRGTLDNSRHQFETQKKGTVAFMGGSITEMNGYRPLVGEFLKKRFPKTAFKFVDAGISSTTSTTGAFRLESDILSKGPIDLLFVEFAVNDDQDGHHAREKCVRGMEGIIRHARLNNPRMDIVVTYFVNEGMIKTLHENKTPLPIEAHEAVVTHYAVSSVNVARELATQITAGTKSAGHAMRIMAFGVN